jgi:hypothetical protein
MDLQKLKTKAKALGATVNDLFVGSIIKAVRDISQNKEQERIYMQVAMSIANPNKSLSDFKPNNDLVAPPLNFDVKESLEE